MDPLTILALAKASYEAVKGGIAIGKELQGMAADVGALFDSVAHLTRVAAQPPGGSLLSGKSAEQIAMETYAAKAEADQMMADLKNAFIGAYGIAAWDDILKEITRIRKAQRAAKIQADQEADERLRTLLFVVPVLGAPVLILAIIVVAIVKS